MVVPGTWHRADIGFIETDEGEEIWFCWQCGKAVSNIGGGVTPRHKGVIPIGRDLTTYIYNRKGEAVGRVR